MENLTIRRFWASLTMMGLMLSQLTTGVFPIPIAPTDAAYAAGFFIEKERIDADEDEPVAPGDTIRYEITIRNNDTKTANARIIDPVPQYLEFVSGSNSCYYENQTDEVICAQQPLSVGASRSERITFRVKSNAPRCTTIENQADVWNDDANPPSGIAPAWSNIVETPTECDDPELEIEKEVDEDTVEPGDDLRYTLRVENVGTGTAQDVIITDNIPNGLQFNDGRSSSECDQSGNRIECDLGDLGEGRSDSVNLYFDVDSTIQAGNNLCGQNIVNQASVTADNADNETSNSVSTRLECPTPNLNITKETNKTTAEVGDEVRFTLEVENTGDTEAQDVIVRDTVPTGLTFDEGASDSLCDENGGVIECGPFDLDDGRDRSIRLVFDVNNQAPCSQNIYNTASAVADNHGSVNSNQVSVYVECPQPKLDIEKSGPSTVVAGNEITYNFTVRNTGNGDAADVYVSDFFINSTLQRISPPFTFVRDAGANCSNGGNQNWTCPLGDIDAGDSKSFSITFEVPDNVPALCGTVVMNQADAHLQADVGGPASDWDKHQVSVTCVQSDTEIELRKTANKNSAEHLEMVTYTLTVENVGNVTAENVEVVDPLPAHTMYLDGQSDPLCDLQNNAVVCDGFDLAPGADRDFDIVLKVLDTAPCDGEIQNRGDARADNAPAVWSNQVDVDVDCDDPSFEATKSVDAALVAPGGRLTYDIEVENTGPVTLEGVWVIDTIPNYLTFNDGASDNRCFQQGNDVKCGDDDIAPGRSDTYTLVFDVNTNAVCGGKIMNDAYIVFTGNSGLDGRTNTVKTIVECDDPDLDLTKSAHVSKADKGDVIKYTLVVKNTGQGTAHNVFVLDDIINEFTFLPAMSTPSCDKNGNTVECGPVDLDPGEEEGFVIAFEVNQNAQCDTTVYNQAEAVADNHGSVLSNSESVDIECDAPEADVKVKKNGPTQIMRGTTIVYDVFVMNLGPDDAEDVVITDAIPEVLEQDTNNYLDLVFNSGDSDNDCRRSGADIICDGFDLRNGESRIVEIAFDVPTNAFCAKPILNQVEVASDTFDPISSNNDDDHLSTVNCATGTLDIFKTGPATTRRGNEITYTVRVENNLGFRVTKNRMIDPVPAHLEFVRADDNSCYYEDRTDEVICGEFDLNAGASKTFELTFKVLSTAPCNGDIINVADIWSNHGNVNPQWSNTVKTKVLCDATLTIEKTDNQTFVNAGDEYDYEIFVSNTSNSDALDVVIVDELPPEVSFVSASAGGSYNSARHEVTWTIDVDANDVELLTVTVEADNAAPGAVIYNEVCIQNGACDDDTTRVPELEFRISKTDGETQTEIGNLLTYVISVTNASQMDAQNVQIVDELPNHVRFLDANRGGSHSGGEVTWVADIDAGRTETFEVTVEVRDTAFDGLVLLNEVCIDGTNTCDDDTTIVIVDEDPILTITKTDNRSTVAPGETLFYEIEIENISQVDALNVEVVDTLPDDVIFIGADAPAGAHDIDHRNGEVTWLIDVDAGETALLRVEVDVRQDAADGTILFNYVEIIGGPDADDVTRVVRDDEKFGCIDIIKETFDTNGDPLTPVTQFTFFLDGNVQTVQNDSRGRARFSNVPVGTHTVTEDLPRTWEQLSVTPNGGRVNVLEGGNCSTVTFKNQQNLGDPEFEIEKTVDETTARPGDRLEYEITVRNEGQTDAKDVEIVDDLPNNVEFVSASDGGRESGGRVRWTVDIDAGRDVTVTLRVDIDDDAEDGDRVENEACVGNECDDATTRVIEDDDDDDDHDDDDDQDDDDDDNGGRVRITVNDDPDPVDVCHDDDLEYELRLTNSSNGNREVDVVATLDSDTDYRSSSDGGRDRGSNRVEWEDIRISRNGTKTLRLRVTVDDRASDGATLRLRAAVSGGDEDTEITRVRNRCDDDDDIVVDDDDDGRPSNPELTIDKTADRTEALPGSPVSYTITIRNPGNRDIQNAVLTDDYPESFITISDSGGGTDNGSQLQWNLGTLRANSTTVVRYRVNLKQGLTRGTRIHNIATVRGGGFTRTDDHTVVIPTPPQTGLGGFIKSLTLSDSYVSESGAPGSSTTVAVRPQARVSDTVAAVPTEPRERPTKEPTIEAIEAVAATTTAATLPVVVWVTTMLTGLGFGGVFGRKFLI